MAPFEDGPELNLYDKEGKPRAGLAVDKDGAGLRLADENGKQRVVLAVDKNGPGLGLVDENGKHRAALIMLGLVLLDEKGEVIWKAP